MRLFSLLPRPALGLLALLGTALLPASRAAAQSFQTVTPIDNTVGNGYVVTNATVTDATGNTYTTGFFYGTVSFGPHVVVSPGRREIFVAKQDPTGAWLWATRAGGLGDDQATGVALDGSGNVLVTGAFRSKPPTGPNQGSAFGATTLISSGSSGDVWVGKLNGTTGAWLWATRAGGAEEDLARGIAVDAAGNALVTGSFSSTGARFGTTVLNAATAGLSDAWVGKLNGATGTWLWAKRAGGTYYDDGNGIAVDAAGNALVTGSFSSANAAFGATTLHNASGVDGDADLWVAKLNGATGAWLWASAATGSSNNMTGPSDEYGQGIAVDATGNPLITGHVSGTTVNFGALAINTNGSGKVLAAKLNGVTGVWLWATTNTGSTYDKGEAISVDAAGNGLITGAISSPDAQFGSTMLAGGSQGTIVVAKVMGNSGTWAWATTGAADANSAEGTGIGVDGSGNPIITGNYSTISNQDVTFGALPLPGGSNGNMVVGKLNGATGAWTRVSSAGTGTGARTATATATDAAGNVYVTGTFSNTLTLGATTLTCMGLADIYVAKQDPSGAWLWAVRAGSSAPLTSNNVNALALDPTGNVLLTGNFNGPNITFGAHTVSNANTAPNASTTDVWVAKLNGANHTWAWAASGGGSLNDDAPGIAVDGTGNALIAGSISSADAMFGTINLPLAGTESLLTAKLNGTTGTWMWAKSAGGSDDDEAGGITVDAAGNGYVAGTLGSSDAQFDAFSLAAQNFGGDALVGKFDGATGAWQWVTQGGGAEYDAAIAIALDGAGNPFITGYSAGGAFGATTLPTQAGNVLIGKLNGATGAWLWANIGGGNQSGQGGNGIALDAAGNGFISGFLRGGVPSVFGATTLHPVDGATGTRQDALVAKFNGLTGAWLWAKSAGGGENDYGYGIAVNGSNQVFMVGSFTSPAADFSPITLYGGTAYSTGFVAKLLDQPTINTLTPAAAPVGTLVTATGTLLSGASLITFAGGATAVPTNVTATSLQFVIPNTANTGAVQVAATAGTGPSTSPLTVVRDLVVSTPATTILPGPYRTITITGTGEGVLGGDVSVSTSMVVRTGGSLDDACHRITGAGTFTLQTGTTLAICDAGGIALTGATGMVQVTGTRTFSAGASYVYDGPAAQSSGSGLPATVQNLTISAPMGVDLTQNVGVKRLLSLTTAGDLRQVEGRVTLLSDPTGTAMLVNAGAGRVLGVAIVQRYITHNGVGMGYRHFSSPVSGATVGGLACPGFTPVVNPAYNTAPDPLAVRPYPTVFGFDETRAPASPEFNKGYFSPATLASPLAVGRGYAVYFPGNSKPSFVGTLNQDDVTFTGLTQTGAFLGAEEKSGWHLLGNPFPAPMNWDLVTIPAGMSSSVSVYATTGGATGHYLTRANGIGDLPYGQIAMGQAFFVRVTGGAPVDFTLPSAARLTTYASPAHYRAAPETRPMISLALRPAGTTTTEAAATTVYFQAGATAALDANFDGPQPAHNQGMPTLVSLTGQGEELAVNGLPLTALSGPATTTVELLADLPAAGTYELAVTALANLPATAAAVLLDRLTNTRYALAAQPTITVAATQAGVVRGRFALVFNPSATVTGTPTAAAREALAALTVWPNPASGTVHIDGAAPGAALSLLDATGRTVRTVAAEATGTATLDLAGLPAGVYVVRAGATTRRLVVE